MLKMAVKGFAFQIILIGMSSSSSLAVTYEKYYCDKGHFLDRSVADDGTQSVHWSRDVDLQSGQKARAGGGYVKGHKIRLGDLALWLDKEIPEKGVWIYRGIGNSITQPAILIFNEHTKLVGIVNVSTMNSDVYRCKLTSTN